MFQQIFNFFVEANAPVINNLNDLCQGIPVETYPDRPQSAPVNKDDQPPRPARPESGKHCIYNLNHNKNKSV